MCPGVSESAGASELAGKGPAWRDKDQASQLGQKLRGGLLLPLLRPAALDAPFQGQGLTP